MTPNITSGTPGTDIPSLSTDYKSNIDIDAHKPTSPIDTDYRPNYDGKLIFNSFTTDYIPKQWFYIYFHNFPLYFKDLASQKPNEYSLSNYDSTVSYEELRARNRQEFDRTQPNKPIYR